MTTTATTTTATATTSAAPAPAVSLSAVVSHVVSTRSVSVPELEVLQEFTDHLDNIPDLMEAGFRLQDMLLVLVKNLNTSMVLPRTKSLVLKILCNIARFSPCRKMTLSVLDSLEANFEIMLQDVEYRNRHKGSPLGDHHALTMLLLLRVTSYELTASELLEFLHGNVLFAQTLILSAFCSENLEKQVYMSLSRILQELANPTLHFTEAMHIKPASEISEFELSKFSSLVNVLLENTLELEIVEEMTARIAQELAKHGDPLPSYLVAIVENFLQYCLNLYWFASQGTVPYREHLGMSSPLVTQLLLPFIKKLLSEVSSSFGIVGKNSSRLPSRQSSALLKISALDSVLFAPMHVMNSLKTALRVLVLSTYRINHTGEGTDSVSSHVQDLLKADPISMTFFRLPRVFLTGNLPLLSLLLSFNINVDCMNDLPPEILANVSYENHPRCLRSEFSSLVLHLADTAGTQCTRDLLLLVEMGNPRLPLAKGNTTHKIIRGLLQNPDAQRAMDLQHQEGKNEDLDFLLQFVRQREDSFKAIHERVGEITHELESLCIPKIPDLRETEQDLAEINKRWEHSKSFHRPVECLVEKVPSPGPMVEPQAYSPARSSSSSTPIATATASTASPLSGPEGSEGDPVAETLEANSVPPQFRCALSGELMKDPVHDPFGFVYERQEVERYLLDDAHRNMCPMNGQELTVGDLQADEDLAERIAQWHVRGALSGISSSS